MKNKKIIITAYVCMCLIAIMVGCNVNNDKSAETNMAMMKKTNPKPITLVSHEKEKKAPVTEIEKHIEDLEAIYDVSVIKGEKETLVVYKVKHMQRFHMKGIEKRLNKMLEENYPEEDFIVSSDYKIFLEAVKLSHKMKDPKFSKEKANNELEKIIKLKKELT